MVESMQPTHPFEDYLRREKIKYLDIIAGDTILDIGGGDGSVWDNYPFPGGVAIHLVEPDDNLAQIAMKKQIYTNRFEWLADVKYLMQFNKVLILGVLEHLDDPYDLLYQLSDANYIYITVPNAHSYHRILGVEMGLIPEETHLGPQDIAIGHKRVFTPESFSNLLDRFIIRNKYKYESEIYTTTFKISNSTDMMEHVHKFHAMNMAAERAGMIGKGMLGAELVGILKRK